MNDSEIFKLTDIMSRTGIESINFDFADMYCDIVHCTITRRAYDSIPVQCCSDNSDDALKRALKLMEQVKPWGGKLKMPSKEKQSFNGGYYREMIDAENEVEFKRRGDSYVITSIRRKDADGFYYSEEPYPVKKEHTFVKDLPDGTQLWAWDNIGFLSGTAGELIVKDGKVIKSRMTAIS